VQGGELREYAWLDFAFGVWHLVTDRENDEVRFWDDRESAHVELEEDGWVVDRAFSRAVSEGLAIRSDLQSHPVRSMRQKPWKAGASFLDGPAVGQLDRCGEHWRGTAMLFCCLAMQEVILVTRRRISEQAAKIIAAALGRYSVQLNCDFPVSSSFPKLSYVRRGPSPA
jgi:hypothetical protein